MKTVVYRAPWRIWRHPCGGLNPFGWRSIDEVQDKTPAGEIWVEGFEVPGDGGERRFRWRLREEFPDDA